MIIRRVHKKVSNWKNISDDERISKLKNLMSAGASASASASIGTGSNIVEELNNTFNDYIKNIKPTNTIIHNYLTNYNKYTVHKLFEIMLKIDKTIIPHISDVSTVDSIYINIHQHRIVKYKEKYIIWSGNANITGVYAYVMDDINRIIKHNSLSYKSPLYGYIYIPITSSGIKYFVSILNEVVKYNTLSLKSYLDFSPITRKFDPKFTEYKDILKFYLPYVKDSIYYFPVKKSMPKMNNIDTKYVDDGISEFVKIVYEESTYDDNTTLYDNKLYFHSINKILNLDIIKNSGEYRTQENIRYIINELQNYVDIIQLHVKGLMVDLNSIIIIAIGGWLLMGIIDNTITIDIDSIYYSSYKVKVMQSRGTVFEYKRNLCTHIIKSIYPSEIRHLLQNYKKMKIGKLLELIWKYEISRRSKIFSTSIQKNKLIINNKDLPNTNLVDIYRHKTQKDIVHYKYILDTNTTDRVVSIKIGHGNIGIISEYTEYPSIVHHTRIGKITKRRTIPRSPKLTKLDTILIHTYRVDKNKLINKLKLFLPIKKITPHFIQSINSFGYLKNRYTDEIKYGKNDPTTHRKKYEILAKYFMDISISEWITILTNKSDNIFRLLTQYTHDTSTANEVWKWLKDKLIMFKSLDISELSIESEKIKEQEKQDERWRIKFNLNPTEKLEVDKIKDLAKRNELLDSYIEHEKLMMMNAIRYSQTMKQDDDTIHENDKMG